MTEGNIRAVLHVWGLAWVVGISLLALDLSTASTTVLFLLPVNYWLSERIFERSFRERPSDDKTE